MFKIEKVEKLPWKRTRSGKKKMFLMYPENSLDYCSWVISLFGKAYRIKYSFKLNYFFIAQRVKRQNMILDSLVQAFVYETIKHEYGSPVTSLVRLQVTGGCTDYFFKGNLNGTDVFIKASLSRMKVDPALGGVLKNEYEKGLLAAECPYFVKPLLYVNASTCEILVTPFIENVRLLEELLVNDSDIPAWVEPQIVEAAEWLKANNLVHRDIHTANIVIGNLPGRETQVFINDLAFMAQKDCEGNIIPVNIESEVRKRKGTPELMNDDIQFSNILARLRKKSAQ
ncbi:MAG: hypothetical protein IKY97_07075 [Mailhella sp.]|nr:hypothetical protein [Mailhella sp.]